MRPHIYLTQTKIEGLRSLDEVRTGIQSGYAKDLWTQLLAKAEHELSEPAWTPKTALPGREEKQIRHENREFELVAHTSNRIMDGALVALVLDDRRFVEAVLQQIDSVYDDDAWPEIEDLTHLAHGDHCSLRRGQLALAIGTAYDWMHALMTVEERERVIAGFDRRFTQAFKAALEAGDRWVNWRQNFCSVIYGGFAIAGMAFGEDYAESDWLIETGRREMEDYIGGLFGPDGEFNESVQYAGSAAHVTDYLMASVYAGDGGKDAIRECGFDDFCRWYMYFTLPPGRVASFGDPSPEMPPVVFHYSAVASALNEPAFQWFYRQYVDRMEPTHRKRAIELLHYDPTIEATSPEGTMPLGRAYDAQAKLFSSRDSWDSASCVSVVSGKAAREFNHSHADWGQVCLDGYGERLLIDLGSPPGYPKSDRERFYNYQQWGHNVFVFGRNETGGVPVTVRDRAGDVIDSSFDEVGARWSIDLTPVYDDVALVRRTVLHLLPRVLVVLDEAELKEEDDISLRWHTCTIPELTPDGRLRVTGEKAAVVGRIERLDGELALSEGRQSYQAPYNRDALGEVYEQRHEPYVEAAVRSRRVRLLSMFCVQQCGSDQEWSAQGEGWSCSTDEGQVMVSVASDAVAVRFTEDPERGVVARIT